LALDVDALRTSFGVAIVRQPDLTHVFYEELFARHPEAKPLFFRRPLEVQEQMLATTIVAALDHLEDAEWLRDELGALGARHAEYGVSEEMYGWVAESLLATLARAVGDDWTPAYEAAWRDALAAIAGLMLAGYTKPEAVA
jgi:hemoglobin-like flavoprotein